MIAWLTLIRYMESSNEYSILGRTLTLSLPNVMRTLVSSVPILIGYTFLGVSIFWRSNRFSSASGSLVTLYALMFGDMVYDTFYDTNYIHYIYSQAYLYTFLFFSICVIQSLFVSVVEDAYISIKYVKKEDILFGTGDDKVPITALARRRFEDDNKLKLSDVKNIPKDELKSKQVLEQLLDDELDVHGKQSNKSKNDVTKEFPPVLDLEEIKQGI